MSSLASLLAQAFAAGASDLLMVPGSSPAVRQHGVLSRLGLPKLGPADTEALAGQVLNEEARRRFEAAGETRVTYSVFGTGRFRISLVRQRGTVSLAVRAIPSVLPPRSELRLPDDLVKLALAEQGLVLISGPPGSGRTTTLAALLEAVNLGRPAHIVTLEQPVEFLHKHQQGLIVQREVGTDTASFATGLESAIAHSPDVVALSQLDPEVTMAAMQLAAAGKMVLAVTTAGTVREAVRLLVAGLPPHRQPLACHLLSGCLVGAVCQHLLPRADGPGRVAGFELLAVGPSAREALSAGDWRELSRLVDDGIEPGTIGIRQALAEMAATGLISHSTYRAKVTALELAAG